MTRHESARLSPLFAARPARRGVTIVILALTTLGWRAADRPATVADGSSPRREPVALAPTSHPPIPTTLDEAWLVPGPTVIPSQAEQALASAISRLSEGNTGQALQLLGDKRLTTSPLGGWAAYYTGLAHLTAGRPADAVRAFQSALDGGAVGATVELASRGLADAAEAAGDAPQSLAVLTALAEKPTAAPDEVLKRLAEVASKAGEGGIARAAWLRLYYEYPLSVFAPLAEPVAAEARAAAGAALGEVLARDVARADRLFSARRYADARAAFERLLAQASGDVRELADLRVAECDYFLRQYRQSLQRLEPWLTRASRRAEARHFSLQSLRALGRKDKYVAQARALVSEFGDSTWAEDTLNSLATYYILENDDAAAAATFKELSERFPDGRSAERAAWKYRLVAIQDWQLRRDQRGLRAGRRICPALGLPSGLVVLVRPRARGARPTGRSAGAIRPGAEGLPPLVLRASGRGSRAGGRR